MTISQNLTAIVALFFICGVYGDSDTCCYGATCPLPIFVQYKGDYDALYGDDLNPGVVDKDACCPDGHTNWLGSDIFDINYGGSIDTACLCGKDQSCDTDNVYGPMCTDESRVTYTSCPDAFVAEWIEDDAISRVINSSNRCWDLGAGCACVYSVTDGGTRGMTQRCVPEKLCVNEDVGVYQTYIRTGWSGRFREGFPFYYSRIVRTFTGSWSGTIGGTVTTNTDKMLRVDDFNSGHYDDYAHWVIRAINITNSTVFPYDFDHVFAYATGIVTEGFEDPSTLSWNNGVSITHGECPTPQPSAQPSLQPTNPTPQPSPSPTNPTPQPAEVPTVPSLLTTDVIHSDNSGGCRDIVIMGVYVLISCVVLRV